MSWIGRITKTAWEMSYDKPFTFPKGVHMITHNTQSIKFEVIFSDRTLEKLVNLSEKFGQISDKTVKKKSPTQWPSNGRLILLSGTSGSHEGIG